MPTLNQAQHQAVTHSTGPALVLAGAGSGKTRVIVERLAWLVEEMGVDPRHLLALTFTNRAAREMRQRTMDRIQAQRFSAWVGTFHSFGLSLLRRHMDAFGHKTSFTVFDDADQLSIMKTLVKQGANSGVSPREALWWVSQRKQMLQDPEASKSEDMAGKGFVELYRGYQSELLRANAVDFDDILLLTARLLTDHGGVLDACHMRYHHVLVDEYQDTNHAQYVIARQLAAGRHNLFVVGDEDQSIYSWRGATIRNILDYNRDYPDAKVYRLEENYRSTAPILAAANAVVAHNTERLGKTLWTARKDGEKVRLFEAVEAEDEARFLAEDIAKGPYTPHQVAVLYRTSGQSRLVEEALRMKGLAYSVVGGVQFYARKEIKDVLAYLRLLVNANDDVSFRRIVNVPARGIGAGTLAQLEEYAAQRRTSLMDVLREVEHDHTMSGRARQSLIEFVHLIDEVAVTARKSPLAVVLGELLMRTGYRDYVQKSDEKDFRTRLEILDEFASACAEYDQRNPEGTLADFLQEMALESDVDGWDESLPSVTLMTCHSAKGLEFDSVYLIGLEEGLLPHASALDSDSELEEERRLCYVAMTRARKRLTLTRAQSRLIFGQRVSNEPSRFVDEIPRNGIEFLSRREAPARVPRPMETPAPSSSGDLKTGAHVWHATFGKGVVMYTKGTGDKQRARIRFQTGRVREFMVSSTPLKVVDGDKR